MTGSPPGRSPRWTSEQAAFWKMAVSYAAVGVAVILIMAKTLAWVMSGSVAMLGSLLDSTLDLVASAINLVAVRHAITPADHEHRFGHGKAEAIAGLAQAAVITGSAAFLMFESIGRLIAPAPIDDSLIAVGVLIGSIGLTLALVLFQRFVIMRTGSLAVSADRLHYAGDLLMNAVVLCAIGAAAWFNIVWADGVGGLAVAGIIGYGAWSIFRQSYDQLMDRELDDSERQRIKDIVLRQPQVRAIHDLRTRRSGAAEFIQFHIELDADISLKLAHDIADDVEDAVLKAFPEADVMIHQDPVGAVERRQVYASK